MNVADIIGKTGTCQPQHEKSCWSVEEVPIVVTEEGLGTQVE